MNGDRDDCIEVDVLLPPHLAEFVRAEARRTGRSPGEVIAEAVDAFLDRNDGN